MNKWSKWKFLIVFYSTSIYWPLLNHYNILKESYHVLISSLIHTQNRDWSGAARHGVSDDEHENGNWKERGYGEVELVLAGRNKESKYAKDAQKRRWNYHVEDMIRWVTHQPVSVVKLAPFLATVHILLHYNWVINQYPGVAIQVIVDYV